MKLHALLSVVFYACAIEAVFIPAIRGPDSIFQVASTDRRRQALYRSVIKNNTWPIYPHGRPLGVSQGSWVNHLLSVFVTECPGISYVYAPVVLWETFLACIQFERHPKGQDPFEPIFIRDEETTDGDATRMAQLLLAKFGEIYYGFENSDADSALCILEVEFLRFIQSDQSFTADTTFYTSKTRQLVRQIKVHSEKLIPVEKLRGFPKAPQGIHAQLGLHSPGQDEVTLGMLANAFADEFDRLDASDVLLVEKMAEVEHQSFLKDEYVIVRVTDGVPLVADEEYGIRGLDWTRQVNFNVKKGILNAATAKTSPASFNADDSESMGNSRMHKFSFGYSLLAGGWQEVFMPRGACCLAYGAYCQSSGNPITYVLKIESRDVKDLEAFMLSPKISLQEGYFGFGEYFHPRLGPVDNHNMVKSLGVNERDALQTENKVQDLINLFLASRSQVIAIGKRVISSECDPEACQIISAQEKLSSVHDLEREISISKEEMASTHMYLSYDDEDFEEFEKLQLVTKAKIVAIQERFMALFDKINSMNDALDSGLSMEEIFTQELKNNLESWMNLLLCHQESYARMIQYFEEDRLRGSCSLRVGVDPLLFHILRGQPTFLYGYEDWDMEAPTYDEKTYDAWSSYEDPPIPFRTEEDVRRLLDDVRRLYFEIQDGSFTIYQLSH